MWSNFIFTQLHFALFLFASLALFWVFWLYFDAWRSRKTFLLFLRAAGFALLALVFLLRAALPDTPLAFYPLIPAVITFFYWRQAKFGLERHLQPIAVSFSWLTISELLGLADLFRATTNLDLYRLIVHGGPLWLLSHFFLLLFVISLTRWVFGYLLKQFQTQIFIIMTTSVTIISLLVAVTFSFILVHSVETESFRQLETNARVFEYSLTSLGQSLLSNTGAVADNPQVISALTSLDRKSLALLSQNYLLHQKNSSLLILDSQGIVVARGENPDQTGDSLASDPLVKRALTGASASSIAAAAAVLSPQISVRAAAPVKSSAGSLIGVALSANVLDATFLTGIKNLTGLDGAIYAGNQLSAAASLPVGLTITNPAIKSRVLSQGLTYSGPVSIANIPYLAAYLPLKDIDNVTIGMLFIGRQQSDLVAAAAKSVTTTFYFSIALILLSLLPAHLIASYISRQVR